MRGIKLLAVVLPFLIASSCTSYAVEYGPYSARVDSVYDGDTIKVTVELWPGLFQKVSVRIGGIDSPEIRTKNVCEKALGFKSKWALKRVLGDMVRISDVSLGKYAGRVIADVHTMQGLDIGAHMIREGFAREYSGGKREPWCQ